MGSFIKHISLAQTLTSEEVKLFKGLNYNQHDGIAAIGDEWNKRGQYPGGSVIWSDDRALAYIFATAYHETARTMQPISEFADRDRDKDGTPDNFQRYDTNTGLGNTKDKDGDGTKYKGRGFVQLTGKANYDRFAKLLHIPLIDHPEMACSLLPAIQIMFEGMGRGLFTGKKLADYFNAEKCDWVNARRIINGTDRAEVIADYAQRFLKAIHNSNNILNGKNI
jgi:predicted chitinase